MRKRTVFLAIVMVALFMNNTYSQTVWGGRVGFCIGGINHTAESLLEQPEFKIWNENEFYVNLGIDGGFVTYTLLSKNIYLNSGAMFSYKHSTMEDSYNFDRLDMKTLWLELPVYVGFAFPVGNKVKPYVQTGPFFGIKLLEKCEYSWGGYYYEWGNNNSYVYEDDMFKFFNMGWSIAGGINFHRFKIEMGYQMGLLNILDVDVKNKEESYYWEVGSEAKLNSLFLGVSLVF